MSVTVARLSGFSYTAQMDLPLLSPGAADALLFDIGRVVLDIDFNKAVACWAGHAGCEPPSSIGRITSRDEIYQRHEKGQISDAEFFGALRGIARDRHLRRAVPGGLERDLCRRNAWHRAAA